MNNRRQNKGFLRIGKKLNMHLEKTDPVKDDITWKTIITVIVVDCYNNGIVGREVKFYLNSNPMDELETTDGEGRVTRELVLEKGTHVIEASLVGQPMVRKKITLHLKDEGEKIPAKLDVIESGSLGKYTIMASVTNEKKKGISGVKVYFTEQDRMEEEKILETDKDGICKLSVIFLDRKRIFTIKTVGLEGETVFLSGPVPKT